MSLKSIGLEINSVSPTAHMPDTDFHCCPVNLKTRRFVNTRHIMIWGNALKTSIPKKEQLRVLDAILVDALASLGKRLKPSEIHTDRYYPLEHFENNILNYDF